MNWNNRLAGHIGSFHYMITKSYHIMNIWYYHYILNSHIMCIRLLGIYIKLEGDKYEFT